MRPTPSSRYKRRAHTKETEAPQHHGAGDGSSVVITATAHIAGTRFPTCVSEIPPQQTHWQGTWPELRELIYGDSSQVGR